MNRRAVVVVVFVLGSVIGAVGTTISNVRAGDWLWFNAGSVSTSADGQTVYVARTSGGDFDVLKSSDGGRTWEKLNVKEKK
jgi:hypothetical protein